MIYSRFFRGFSLVEVLVILGILAIVLTLLVPKLNVPNDKIGLESTSQQLYSLFNLIQLQSINSDQVIGVTFNYNGNTGQLESLQYNTKGIREGENLDRFEEQLDFPAGIVVSTNLIVSELSFYPDKTFRYLVGDELVASENFYLRFNTNKNQTIIIFYNHSGKIVLDD